MRSTTEGRGSPRPGFFMGRMDGRRTDRRFAGRDPPRIRVQPRDRPLAWLYRTKSRRSPRWRAHEGLKRSPPEWEYGGSTTRPSLGLLLLIHERKARGDADEETGQSSTKSIPTALLEASVLEAITERAAGVGSGGGGFCRTSLGPTERERRQIKDHVPGHSEGRSRCAGTGGRAEIRIAPQVVVARGGRCFEEAGRRV